MKYIDAEKLKWFVESIGLTPQKSADYNDGRDAVKMMVLDFINYLQQEEVCIFKPNMTINEMIDSINGKQPEQQEWDLEEVDLTEEINRYCGTRDVRPVPDFMETVARHFYELGLNARKEE